MVQPKVLIAEADASLSGSIVRQFRATGWEVVSARAPEAVIELTAEHHPDVVLLDADVGGIELLERLRADPATSKVPIAMMSPDCPPEVRDCCVAAGALVFLGMPLRIPSIEALKKVVALAHAPPRVLISDDDDMTVRALERAARREGLDPVSETHADRVVALARETHPHVIVLDVVQQELDGRDVLALLKTDPATKDIRVVMLTGVEDQRTRHACLTLGADDYVVKPLDPLFFVRIARKLEHRL